ncbi:MAG: reverse transcriptase-like protein [Melioribacteraceae bacterium]|nr:reverse transcriptase-like protein [Melioribacteraceae bacterium]
MKIRIDWTYKTPKGTEAEFHSDELSVAHALLIAEDMERTGRIKSVIFTDQYDSTWTVKEMKAYIKGIETEPHHIKLYFDGGFDHSTNKSGLGCVIYYEQSGKSYRFRSNAPSSELTSNNEAEYASLFLAVQELELLNVHHQPVTIIGDSQVVINQMNEKWPTLEQNFLKWADRIEEKMKNLGIQPEYELVPRKANAEADRLATQALSGISVTATTEIL